MKHTTKWFTVRSIVGKLTKTLETSEVEFICMRDPALAQPKDLCFVSNQNKVTTKHWYEEKKPEE